MRAWRICRESYSVDPLGGRGGLFTSGRWHSRGNRIVYCSASLSLAALEVLVHADRDSLPADLIQLEVDIPDEIEISQVDTKALPKSWRKYPPPTALQRLGDTWLQDNDTAVLEVPSAVIPEEVNLVINPQHADAGAIEVVSQRPFGFDPRLV